MNFFEMLVFLRISDDFAKDWREENFYFFFLKNFDMRRNFFLRKLVQRVYETRKKVLSQTSRTSEVQKHKCYWISVWLFVSFFGPHVLNVECIMHIEFWMRVVSIYLHQKVFQGFLLISLCKHIKLTLICIKSYNKIATFLCVINN